MREKEELDSIINMMSWWVSQVNMRNSRNDTSINKTSENLVLRLLNAAYDYNLTNLNWEHNNKEAVDLGDRERGIAFQVTAKDTLAKVKDTLKKFFSIKGPHKDFPGGIYFFFLTEKPPSLKAKTKQSLQKFAPGFNADQQMWSMNTLQTRMEKLYSTNRDHFDRVKKTLEEEFGGNEINRKAINSFPNLSLKRSGNSIKPSPLSDSDAIDLGRENLKTIKSIDDSYIKGGDHIWEAKQLFENEKSNIKDSITWAMEKAFPACPLFASLLCEVIYCR